jgi:hypothetical protein
MAAPELPSLDVLASIPDPAGDTASRTMPAPVVPPLPSLTRAERRRRAILYAVLSLSWIGGVVWYSEPRDDMGNAGAIAPIAIWTLASAGALALALFPRRRGLPPGIRALQLVLAGIPVLFVVSVLIVSAGVPAAPFSLRWRGGGACMTISSLMGIGPLLFASLALQGSFLSAPIVRGAAVGILCGLFGAIGMHAVCPCAVRSHLLLGHGTPILLLALVGGALGALRGRA